MKIINIPTHTEKNLNIMLRDGTLAKCQIEMT